ncbi:MAG: TRAP transporter small permease subunit [Alphaproteobacteria bacterium]|jgi:TRAP-type mannitol/chloroaromatic compound transport system permease small subunit|nr:TRAP transporter small permease subunit [Alphaproteobacteria bacterium]
MPNLTFVLPHWFYWSGLVFLPLGAMWLARRSETRLGPRGLSRGIAYLFLVTTGFIGIHRFYCRNWLGVLYLPVFGVMLYCNARVRGLRNAVSQARHDLAGADFAVERLQKAIAVGQSDAADKLAQAQAQLAAARDALAVRLSQFDAWDTAAMALLIVILAGLAFDAWRLPKLLRTAAAREGAEPSSPISILPPAETGHARGGRLARTIDGLSRWSGHFVAYWSVIAVFVYYYEVIARYVFNSPTNWAHESMFLMFGMQYLLAGAFALREDAHVRVDVLYGMLGRRAQAAVDIATSVFFFIFCSALLWTGWTFFLDSYSVREVSFTEWAIQYWPVKFSMVLGAALILLQGGVKLTRDIAVLRGTGQ